MSEVALILGSLPNGLRFQVEVSTIAKLRAKDKVLGDGTDILDDLIAAKNKNYDDMTPLQYLDGVIDYYHQAYDEGCNNTELLKEWLTEKSWGEIKRFVRILDYPDVSDLWKTISLDVVM